MKKPFKIIAISILLIGFVSCSQTHPPSKETSISEQENIFIDLDADVFKTKIEKGDGTLLDVRTLGEIKSGKIKGAKHIDYYSSDFISQVSELDKKKPVYLYCASGGRSGGAMLKMKSLGFTELYNLNGGIGAWKKSGYPTIK